MIRRITITSSDTTLSGKYRSGDMVLVFCDATNEALSIVLPDAVSLADVQFFFVKTDSSSNTVTLTTRNAQTINGVSSWVIGSQYHAVILTEDGDNWYVLSDSANKSGYCLSLVASDTAVTTGDGTEAFTVPAEWHGKKVKSVTVSVYDKGVTGTTDVQIRRRRAGSDVDVLSTKVTVGDEYYAADGVVNTSNDDLQTGDQIYVDVDTIHSGTAPNGLSVTVMVG